MADGRPLPLVIDRLGTISGPGVVVLHGFAGGASAVRELTEPLAGAGLAVTVPDLVGHGRSPAPESVTDYTMTACIAQLDAVAPPDARVLVGYSMGGRVALRWAVANPERFSHMVLIGATPGLRDRAEAARRRGDDEALADRIEGQGVDWFDPYWQARPIFATQQRRVTEARRAELSALRRTHTAVGLANSLRGMGTGAMPAIEVDQLAGLDIETLVLAGHDDAKFTAIGRDLATAVGAGRFQAIADAGHACHLEQSAAVARAILEFLEA